MANTYQEYAADGSTTQFAVPFPYLSQTHVYVSVDGVDVDFSFLDTTTVELDSTPANGTVVKVYRVTPSGERLVDFMDGSTLTENDLDASAAQQFYLTQEQEDRVAELETLQEDAETAKDSAEASAAAASVSETNAAESETNAATSETNAAASASAAATSASEAAAAAAGAVDDKADKITPAVVGNIATLNAEGNLQDGGLNITSVASDISALKTNISLLGFRLAASASYSIQGMVDGIIDELEDEDGIAAATAAHYDSSFNAYLSLDNNTSVWSKTMTGNAGTNWANMSVRVVLSAADISQSGDRIRVSLEARSQEDLVIDRVSIVEQDTGANGTETPTELLFNGGNSGVTVPAGETVASDWTAFDVDDTKSYIVIFDIADSVTYPLNCAGGTTYYKASTDSWDQATVTGFSNQANTFSVVKLETIDVSNMTITSNDVEAYYEPTDAIIYVLADLQGSTINTDLKAFVSKTGGSGYDEATLEEVVDFGGGVKLYSCEVSLSGSGDQTMKWQVTSHNLIDPPIELHGVALSWA